jgi:transcriptional regulator with XRE-family HTH domain
MDLRQVFAANLRRYRYAKGLSQEELAFRAKINRTYVSKLENGATWAGLEVIAKVARVLGVEAAELLVKPKRVTPKGA